jgi:hypothetical protein
MREAAEARAASARMVERIVSVVSEGWVVVKASGMMPETVVQ